MGVWSLGLLLCRRERRYMLRVWSLRLILRSVCMFLWNVGIIATLPLCSPFLYYSVQHLLLRAQLVLQFLVRLMLIP